jgi:hypothetical protein
VDKVIGLALIGVVCALLVLAWWIPAKPVRRLLAATAIAAWVVALLGFLGVLALESAQLGPASGDCPIPGPDDSAVAASHWSWVPPGAVCEYAGGEVGPTYWRVPAAIGLVAIPVATTAAWPRRRTRWSTHIGEAATA